MALVVITAILAWLLYSLLMGSLNLAPVEELVTEVLDGDMQALPEDFDVATLWWFAGR